MQQKPMSNALFIENRLARFLKEGEHRSLGERSQHCIAAEVVYEGMYTPLILENMILIIVLTTLIQRRGENSEVFLVMSIFSGMLSLPVI